MAKKPKKPKSNTLAAWEGYEKRIKAWAKKKTDKANAEKKKKAAKIAAKKRIESIRNKYK